MDIIGGVRHVSSLRHWQFLAGGGGTNGVFQARLRQVAETMQKTHFAGTPIMQIEVGADGRDMNSFHAEMNFAASAAHTPWGDVTNLSMDAACSRLVDPGQQPFLHVEWSASSLAMPWARSRKISSMISFSLGANSNLDVEIRLDAARCDLALDAAGSNWFGAGRLSWNGSMTLASNFIPLLAAGKLRAVDSQTPWGSAHELSLEGRAARANDPAPPETGWGPWTRIAPWTLDWQAEVRNLASPKLGLDHLSFSGHWRALQVVIENLQGELHGGKMNAGAILDVASRELRCNGVTDFDPHSVSQLLKPAASNWLAQLDWTMPPTVNAQLRVVLPPWTNPPAEGAASLGSTLQLTGDFAVGPSSFRQVPVRSATGRVTFTNGVWSVSRLRAVRPEGNVDLEYTSSTRTQNYRFIVDSHLDPQAVLPLLPARQKHILDELVFKQPPEVHAEVWGCWNTSKRTGFTATVLATNFMARGETVAACRAALDYTNLILSIHNFSFSNDQSQAQAPFLQADFGTKMARLTNATGSLDPGLLERILRRNPPDWLKRIRFDTPPSISVSGAFSLTNARAMDLHFLVSGQGLHYGSLFADRATGGVDWTGLTVTLTNIVASVYNNGTLMGWLAFMGSPKHGSDFRADFTGRDIDLSVLVTGMTGRTNHLEGRVDGDLALKGPNSSDTSHWQGGGRIHVHDGLLWDIKLFGLLSPVLNIFSPGWGYSRARQATADFVITNGTISSDDLQVRCTGFWINLRGTVDKNKQINARLEAILSRETPVIGPVLSLVFTPLSKLFEYRVSGPVRDPVLEPIFVPRFVMFLLHPFKTLKTPSSAEPPPTLDNTK
jgi:hypothetical protein